MTRPNPARGLRGKQRSVHNTYFTLPVLFLMISDHYPITYSSRWNWLTLLAIALIGAAVRRVFVLRRTGRPNPGCCRGRAGLRPAGGGGDAAGASHRSTPPRPRQSDFPAAPFPVVQAIIQARCTACHALHPTMPGFDEPPQGVIFETAEQIVQRPN